MRLTPVLLTILLVALVLAAPPPPAAGLVPPHLGYGANVASLDLALMQSLGLNWLKLFGPPGERHPLNVLLRVEATAADMANLNAFGDAVHNIAAGHGPFIEAYEIGNEPNLDASYGWAAPPVAADYAALLCVAYQRIKQADSESIVVSAGLAPTGRVKGNWNGHPGHNGLYQDERQFLIEFLAAGGGDCLDVVGYHPYGFSADFDAEPDVPSGDPRHNCTNGFCFRGTEKIYEIMVAEGLGGKKVWATEFGWIVQPPDHCLDDPGWQGRLWQIVSEERQAANLRGAYEYADAHWPWMGAVIFFNLNFNTVGWYPECEPMRFYSVENRPAEDALRATPKRYAALPPSLTAAPATLRFLMDVDEQPATQTADLQLANAGWQSLAYTVTADGGGQVVPLIPDPSGDIAPTQEAAVAMTVNSNSRPLGLYTGLVTVSAPPGTLGAPADIAIELLVVEEVARLFMPAVPRGQP